MSTLAQMRSRIADDLMRSDINTQIDKSINRAIEYYYNKGGFWFDETTGTFATIASQEAYGTADGLPSDIAEIYYVRLTIGSTNKPELRLKSYPAIQLLNMGAATGTPSDYAWYQNKMYLSLIPNSIWTVTISYRKTYSTLSNDADENNYTNYAEDLIESRARGWINKRIIKNYEAASLDKEEELDAFSALRKRSQTMTSTGTIQPTDF